MQNPPTILIRKLSVGKDEKVEDLVSSVTSASGNKTRKAISWRDVAMDFSDGKTFSE